ncbi:MAG: hypothetical protein E5V49_03885 [Mesorhizobium sp.]|nr:hypothetical protein EN848_22205 [bacterium M00.F.Ca.ET.205.01.1.1]TGU50972.1 hypothetical protein EN795_21750 [bacterium M00.F.Ca.ET.152.01.1.1]TGV34461.1 hypothetical protein EN829_019700 [Mesorhizobium sp. M00.F.Ca.ET.186.01.1.1]TGZ41869.1 hypothetical protein EN805_16345 [bacterium M00.F.Ca.ET.162.01.1.1]TIW62585.1 MAG: hypothetical protein E5V48_03770 [Mesorhizobium sp.]
MPNRGTAASEAMRVRVGDLKAGMQAAQISESDVETFQKIAAKMEGGSGRIDGDDLIAASFVAGPDAD